LIVAALYTIGGCLALFFGWQQVKETRVTPEHTIRTLKEDKIWLQTEVKTQL
jgi:Putative Actinobacterial Holin-X, holin superfamily III